MKNIKNLSFALLLLPNIFMAQSVDENESLKKAIDSYNKRSFQESYLGLKANATNFDDRLMFMLARSAYEVGKFDEAEKIYKELLAKDSNNSRVKLELAQTYFKQKKI